MAFTLMKGTIHASLNAFDYELSRVAKLVEFKEKNGVVVSVPITAGMLYFTAAARVDPRRDVIVIASEDKQVVVTCKVGGCDVARTVMTYPMVFIHNKEILNFLIDGITPTFSKDQ